MEVNSVLIYLPDGSRDSIEVGQYGVVSIHVDLEERSVQVVYRNLSTKIYSQFPFIARD